MMFSSVFTMRAAPHPFSIRYAVFQSGKRPLPVGILGRSDAAIYRTALKAKTPAQSSKIGVIANHSKKLLCCLLAVKRAVLFLCHPELMQQHSQFSGYRN